MKIAIYGQFYNSNTQESIHTLLNFFLRKKSNVHIENLFFDSILTGNGSTEKYNAFKTFKSLDDSFDLLISIGGDGTILRAVTFVNDLSIPIVGINTGRLGFLSTIQTNEIEEAIDHILNRNYKISERTLLSVETAPENKDLTELNFALNEIAVSRKNTT
ncbi:MAG TPA: NAD(+)/NADH kinase, partial [Flavobacteriaceae bacterium]|nr:NAD(+)/NADH kinase [Flavobacteriaceae bacterium]